MGDFKQGSMILGKTNPNSKVKIDKKNVKVSKEGYPNADSVMERGVLLPLHHGMTDEMFTRLHKTIDEFIKIHA